MDHLRAVPSDAPSPEGASEGHALAGLLVRSSRGDSEAFGAFYDATSARAFGLAVRSGACFGLRKLTSVATPPITEV